MYSAEADENVSTDGDCGTSPVSIVSVGAGSSRSINQPATVEAQVFLSFIGRKWAMMKGTLLRNRESLSYVRLLSDHGFTDFDDSGFRELRTCVTPAGGINMRRIRSSSLRLFLFFNL